MAICPIELIDGEEGQNLRLYSIYLQHDDLAGDVPCCSWNLYRAPSLLTTY